MDIEGLGKSAVNQLLEKGFVKDLADIYFLTEEKLLGLDLFKAKKAKNLIVAIETSKKQALSKFLFALGIANIGEKAAFVLAQKYESIDSIEKVKAEELEKIYEIGKVMAGSIEEFFKQPSAKKLLLKFKKAGLYMKEKVQKIKNNKFEGKRFVFTGELASLSRNKAALMVKELGGEVTSSVSKNTDFVVAGDNPGSKYKKAINLGIKVLSQAEFEKKLV